MLVDVAVTRTAKKLFNHDCGLLYCNTLEVMRVFFQVRQICGFTPPCNDTTVPYFACLCEDVFTAGMMWGPLRLGTLFDVLKSSS